ncbi:unnamed protein product, partial [marine sediment metagenome]
MPGGTINAGKAVLTLTLDDKKLKQGFAKAERNVRNLGRSMQKAGNFLAPFAAAAGGAMAFLISKASEAQETWGKFETVFGDSTESMRKWAQDTSKIMGRSVITIANAAARFS